MTPTPIAYLEPGRIYVLRANFQTKDDYERFRMQLSQECPDCRFVIFPKSLELMGSAPALVGSAEEFLEQLRVWGNQGWVPKGPTPPIGPVVK